jgi:hypothetical protein
MKATLLLITLTSTLLLTGCSINIGPKAPPACGFPAPPMQFDESGFAARLQSADSITSFTTRDKALTSIAIDAATVGDLHAACKSLSKMTSFTAKDSTAERCADLFLQQGFIAEAKMMTDHVTSFTIRDRILTKIAQTPSAAPLY